MYTLNQNVAKMNNPSDGNVRELGGDLNSFHDYVIQL